MVINKKATSSEIDLFEFSKILWDKKVIYMVIVLFSVGLGIFLGKENYKQDSFIVSIKISPSKNSEFYKFLSLTSKLDKIDEELMFRRDLLSMNNDIELTESSFGFDSQVILENFVQELTDYKEVEQVLANVPNIKKKIQLSAKDKKKILSRYVKLISLDKVLEKNDYILKLNWHNAEEGIEILSEILKLTSINFNNSKFKKLETLINLQKNLIFERDLDRIDYLTEQSEIAKEIDIEENKIENINNISETNFLLNINTNTNVAYYLRGYKAIDKEIELIKSRDYKRITKMESKLSSLKNDDTEWISYNPLLSEILKISNDNRKKYLILSTILGLIFGATFIYLLNEFQIRKVKKKI